MALVTLADYTGTTPCILHDPPATLDGDETGWRGNMTFKVPYDEMADFCQFAGGKPYTISISGIPTTRYIPLSHPQFSGLICKRVQARATGQWDGTHNWDWCRVTCEFQSVPYGMDGSTPFLTIETTGSSESITIPQTAYYFPSDNKRIRQDVAIAVPVVTYAITTYLVPTLDDALYKTLVGKVNDASFLGFAAGMMRFDTWRSALQMSATLASTYTTTLYFSFRPVEWNKFLRPDGTWEAAKKSVDNTYAYSSGDFSQLIA